MPPDRGRESLLGEFWRIPRAGPPARGRARRVNRPRSTTFRFRSTTRPTPLHAPNYAYKRRWRAIWIHLYVTLIMRRIPISQLCPRMPLSGSHDVKLYELVFLNLLLLCFCLLFQFLSPFVFCSKINHQTVANTTCARPETHPTLPPQRRHRRRRRCC